MLLAIWADVGEHMRRYLEAYTLADIVAHGPGRDRPGPASRP